MKILAISGGRANGNNELLLKTALKEAKAVSGAEVEVIRMKDINLRFCSGCETCMRGLTTGGNGDCVYQDDDLGFLKEHIREADGFLVTAPVYDMIPSGAMVNLVNRALGVGKDFQQACRSNPKVGAVISVGGSDWIDFTEPIVNLILCNLSKSAQVVDRLIAGHNTAPGMVGCREDLLERAKLLGRRVGEALLKRERGEAFGYEGDEGICPVCHISLLEMTGATSVRCPYCAAKGELAVEDGKIRILWDADIMEHNRFTVWGENDHRGGIGASHKLAAENKELIKEKIKELEDFGGIFIKPER